MIVVTPTRVPARRTNRPKKAPPALTLVAATFTSAGGPYVRLTFDRAVSIASIDVTAITVDNQPGGAILRGSGTATLFSPQTVQVPLSSIGMTSGTLVLTTATAATKIVAGDGGVWGGVTTLPLPF